jgi:hypothetical protein
MAGVCDQVGKFGSFDSEFYRKTSAQPAVFSTSGFPPSLSASVFVKTSLDKMARQADK